VRGKEGGRTFGELAVVACDPRVPLISSHVSAPSPVPSSITECPSLMRIGARGGEFGGAGEELDRVAECDGTAFVVRPDASESQSER
jgi:hypothetical protein